MAEQVETAALSSGAVPESDNLIVKSALFARSAITSAPSFIPGLWRYYGKERAAALGRFFKEYRPHPPCIWRWRWLCSAASVSPRTISSPPA